MINIYTIGFTQKTAHHFFNLLKEAKIDCLVDVRLNNVSQLAGYTKSTDLEYFLKEILGVSYRHSTKLAPTKEILDNFKKKKITWKEYENQYLKLKPYLLFGQYLYVPVIFCDRVFFISRRKTMTPRPPMKWVDDRQKRRLLGRLSMSVRIVDPVVV